MNGEHVSFKFVSPEPITVLNMWAHERKNERTIGRKEEKEEERKRENTYLGTVMKIRILE